MWICVETTPLGQLQNCYLHMYVSKYIKITVTFISISAGYILFIFSFCFHEIKFNLNVHNANEDYKYCMHFWRPSENKTLNNKQLQNFKHVAGRIWYFLRHVSLSLSLHLKMALSVYFLTWGMCDSSNLFTLYYMVYTCILGDNDAIIWSVYHQIEYTPAF